METEIDYCKKMGYHTNDQQSLRDLAFMLLQYKEYLLEKGEVNEKLQENHNQSNFKFTERELEVIKLAYLPDKIIAYHLHISYFTIHSHMQNIRQKYGFKNKYEIIRYATHAGLIKIDDF